MIDLATGQDQFTSPEPESARRANRRQSDGTLAVISGVDNELFVLNLETRAMVGQLPKTNARVYRMAFTPDGRHLVTRHLGRDQPLGVWNPHAGTLVHQIMPRQRTLLRLFCCSPDGKHIVTAGDDGVQRLWDVNTGSQVKTLGEDWNSSRMMATPNGRKMIVGMRHLGGWMTVFDVVDAKAPPRRHEADRKLANMVLSHRGTVCIMHEGRVPIISKAEDLPGTPFLVRLVVVQDRQLSQQEIGLLSTVGSLEQVTLLYTPLTDKSLATLKDSLSIYHLHAWRYQNHRCGPGFDCALNAIEWLALNQLPGISSRGLAHLKGRHRLKVLHLTKSPVDDSSFDHLAKCRALTHLYMADTQVQGTD